MLLVYVITPMLYELVFYFYFILYRQSIVFLIFFLYDAGDHNQQEK